MMAEAVKEMRRKEVGTSPDSGVVEHTRARKVYTPRVDIVETKDDIVVIADMPGVNAHSVDVTLERDVLTIYGRVDVDIPENARPVHREYGIGDYYRAFTLSEEIDRDRIEAKVKNGVLRLLLPKAEGAKTKKIAVKAE